MSDVRNVIIIGSGPAGLTAAIYNSRADLKPLVIGGIAFGGQLMNTTEVENFPGFPEGIMGPELMQNMLKQAQKFGSEVMFDNVTKVDFSGDVKKVYVGEKEYLAKAIIIATGADPRKLNVEGEEKYSGRGVSYCATCDGAFFREKVVAIVGGGDSAAEEADFLTRFASKVYMIIRKDNMKASKAMQERVNNNPKIEIIWNSSVKEFRGDDNVLTNILLSNSKTNEQQELAMDGVFVAIGHVPSTAYLEDAIAKDDGGYIEVIGRTHTNIDGVFVAGDVQDSHYQQGITAAGLGCMAALDAEKWLAANS